MEGWTGNVSFTQLPEKVGLNLQDIWGNCGPGWGLEAGVFLAQEVNGEDSHHGWSWVRLRMVFTSFPFTCLWSLSSSLLFSLKGIPFLLVAQWFFFPPPAFPHLPEPPCSLQFCQFLCALSPSVFVSFYVPSFSFSFSALVHILSTTLLKHLSSTFNSYLPKQFFLFISLLCLEIFADSKYELGLFLKKRKKSVCPRISLM